MHRFTLFVQDISKLFILFFQNSEAISTVVKVLAALPLSLLTVYAVAHFVYAMFFSQTKAVASAAKLTEFSSTVTVALSIKNEVNIFED